MEDLVPGINIPLRASLTAIELVQMQKLNTVKFEFTPDEGEIITISMTTAPRERVEDDE